MSHLKPVRRLISINEGQWLVGITPPDFIGGDEVTVKLTEDQFRRFLQWLDGRDLIQQCLPDLNVSEREKILSGLDDEAFAAACEEDDDND